MFNDNKKILFRSYTIREGFQKINQKSIKNSHETEFHGWSIPGNLLRFLATMTAANILIHIQDYARPLVSFGQNLQSRLKISVTVVVVKHLQYFYSQPTWKGDLWFDECSSKQMFVPDNKSFHASLCLLFCLLVSIWWYVAQLLPKLRSRKVPSAQASPPTLLQAIRHPLLHLGHLSSLQFERRSPLYSCKPLVHKPLRINILEESPSLLLGAHENRFS